MKRKNFEGRRNKRKDEAKERQESYSLLTPSQKLEKLNSKGLKAEKERKRLSL